MNITIFLIMIAVFLFSLWFKRSEKITICNKERGYALSEKTPWIKSLRFAVFMTILITSQWILLKMFLFSI